MAVGVELCGFAGLAVAEQYELDTVEAEKALAERVVGHLWSILAIEVLNHFRTFKQYEQLAQVKWPRVDVRVDAEVGSSTQQEGLALLIVRAGFEEFVAGVVHHFLRHAVGL